MRTIYSEIIWGELKLKDYKIHEEPAEKTEGLILDWVKNSSLEKVEEVLCEISWIDRITNAGYYDGMFYGVSQRDKDKQNKRDDGMPEPDLIIHDTGVFPSLLHIAMKVRFSPSELRFMADVLEAYYEKLPKGVCGSRTNEGDEI